MKRRARKTFTLLLSDRAELIIFIAGISATGRLLELFLSIYYASQDGRYCQPGELLCRCHARNVFPRLRAYAGFAEKRAVGEKGHIAPLMLNLRRSQRCDGNAQVGFSR